MNLSLLSHGEMWLRWRRRRNETKQEEELTDGGVVWKIIEECLSFCFTDDDRNDKKIKMFSYIKRWNWLKF